MSKNTPRKMKKKVSRKKMIVLEKRARINQFHQSIGQLHRMKSIFLKSTINLSTRISIQGHMEKFKFGIHVWVPGHGN